MGKWVLGICVPVWGIELITLRPITGGGASKLQVQAQAQAHVPINQNEINSSYSSRELYENFFIL
jgi:hypothetical protein